MRINGAASGSTLGRGGDRRTRRALMVLLTLLAIAAATIGLARIRPPAEFREREALSSCGSASTASDGSVPALAVQCIDAALRDRRGAELHVRDFSIEGDPIHRYYRALPQGGVEVFIDSSDDTFGSGGWSYRRCAQATSFAALGSCTLRGL